MTGLERPVADTPLNELTVAELLMEVWSRAHERQQTHVGGNPNAGRELALVKTAVEDAIMRHNRAVYMERHLFNVTDAERAK